MFSHELFEKSQLISTAINFKLDGKSSRFRDVPTNNNAYHSCHTKVSLQSIVERDLRVKSVKEKFKSMNIFSTKDGKLMVNPTEFEKILKRKIPQIQECSNGGEYHRTKNSIFFMFFRNIEL